MIIGKLIVRKAMKIRENVKVDETLKSTEPMKSYLTSPSSHGLMLTSSCWVFMSIVAGFLESITTHLVCYNEIGRKQRSIRQLDSKRRFKIKIKKQKQTEKLKEVQKIFLGNLKHLL